jgi:hypothetical protein
MPVWGNRMVCETANYKHIEEKKKEMLERENRDRFYETPFRPKNVSDKFSSSNLDTFSPPKQRK